jgi:hypothetical protein
MKNSIAVVRLASVKSTECQLPAQSRDNDGGKTADGGRFGRAEPAGIDAADRQQENEQELPHSE